MCLWSKQKVELLDFLRYHRAGLSQRQEDLNSSDLQIHHMSLADPGSLGNDQRAIAREPSRGAAES